MSSLELFLGISIADQAKSSSYEDIKLLPFTHRNTQVETTHEKAKHAHEKAKHAET